MLVVSHNTFDHNQARGAAGDGSASFGGAIGNASSTLLGSACQLLGNETHGGNGGKGRAGCGGCFGLGDAISPTARAARGGWQRDRATSPARGPPADGSGGNGGEVINLTGTVTGSDCSIA